MVEHVELILRAVLDFTRQTAGPSPFCVFTYRGQTGRGSKCVQDVKRLRLIDNGQLNLLISRCPSSLCSVTFVVIRRTFDQLNQLPTIFDNRLWCKI